jgi:hypothetical protein
MKKIVLLFFIITLISFVSCKKEDEQSTENEEATLQPEQEQRGFAINYTAYWCSPCGNWGAPLIHDYAEDAPAGAIICAHAGNDPMYNYALFSSFTGDRTTGGGIPSFWVGDVETISSNAMINLLNTTPVAGVDYEYEVKDGKMNINVKVKFFEAGTGEYYLSVIVLEDGIPGGTSAPSNYQQSGTNDPNYTHDFVLRTAATPNNAYGELIVNNPSANDEVDKSYSIDLDASWDDIYPVCIIWKKDSSNGRPYYKYINSLKKK